MDGKSKTPLGNETNEEEAKAEIRKHLLDYLSDTGRKLDRGYMKCLNPSHDDKHPSMSFDAKRNALHCFACGATYDIFDLYEQDHKTDFLGAFSALSVKYLGKPLKTAYEPKKGQNEDIEATLKRMGNEQAIAYLKDDRGFAHAREVVSFARIKATQEAIYFPHYHFENGEYKPTDYQTRRLPTSTGGLRYDRSHGIPTSVYDALGAFDYPTEGANIVAITEGEIDALTIFDIKLDEEGKEALKSLRPVAMSGCENKRQLADALKRIDIKKYCFILCLDGDKPGKDATIEVSKILDGMGARYSTFDNYPKGIKDFNEWALKDREGLKNELTDLCANFDKNSSGEKSAEEKALEAYKSEHGAEGVANSLMGDILSPVDTNPIKTGFSNLDIALGGEINAGVMTIGGLSSLGKTSFILQIADQIALEGKRDALYFSLEMSARELVAKSVSRLTYLLDGKALAKTTAGIMQKSRWKRYSEQERSAIYKAFTAYKGIAKGLYFIEPNKAYSAQDIAKAVREHIATTKRKPVVFIDYLQILSPITPRATDKQAIDENITALKRLSAQEGLLIVLVSSISRSKYSQTISMDSFKESGSIEYSSDYLLGMDFQDFLTDDFNKLAEANNTIEINKRIKANKAKEPREVVVSVLKNRNGQTGETASFSFYSMFNCFIERNSELKEQTDRASELARQASEKGEALEDDNLPF